MAINARATQEFVPISDIKDGIITLKDGSLRAVLLASSINFSLKSNDEREATLYQFQDFLNSLDFSVQIFIQSRRLDIRPYIALLEGREKKQVNDLMKIQVQEYIGFIKNFTENSNIMTKHFFVVVPYSPATLQGKNTIFGLFGKKKSVEDKKISTQEVFEEHRTQLEQRLSVVEQGLVRTGVRIVPLGTEEIVELFYKIFNPGDAEKPIQLS
ncbi:hypothetical protein EXS61_02420 [Candidatus Parcubacteria bacterium]|nr:hypothetical protein [Candidatus Parcubacteria bacterium]